MKYTLKTKGENDFDSVIEITGLSTEITINALLDHLEASQRTKMETSSQKQVTQLFLDKALEVMPQLGEIKEEHVALATEFFMKKGLQRTADELLKSCDESIEKYTTHLKAIEEATGIKCLPEIAPFQPVDFAEKSEESHG